MDSRTGAGPGRFRLIFLRLLLAVSVSILFFGLLETALRFAGQGFDPAFTRRTTVADHAVIVDNPAFTWQFFPPAIARTVPSFAFDEAKPAGTRRVFVLGASAAQGDPEPSYGFARILEIMLEHRHPETDFEVINTAITAVNSHVVYQQAKELTKAEADLFIIYLGNNEVVGPFGASNVFARMSDDLGFIRAQVRLRRTHTGQMLAHAMRIDAGPAEWTGMEMFLGQQIRYDDSRLQSIYRHFSENLDDIIDLATGSGAPVVLSTVAVNLRDCAPFASQPDPLLAESQASAWRRLYEEGMSGSAEPAQALASLDRAARIDSTHAELQFRRARHYEGAGRAADALRAYRSARNHDVLRFRADDPINAVIRRLANHRESAGVYLADAEASVASGGRVPGADLFVDHVHPTFAGNYLIARELARAAEEALALPGGSDWPTRQTCAERLALTDFDRRRIVDDMLVRLGRAPFTNQMNHAAQIDLMKTRAESLGGDWQPADWDRFVRTYAAAVKMRPTDARLRYNYGVLLLEAGRPGAAVGELREFLRRLPHDVPGREKYASALVKVGDYEEGIRRCRSLIADWPEFEVPYYTLGFALATVGRFRESLEVYETLLDVDPGSAADIHTEIGRLYLRLGDDQAAVASFQAAVDAAGQDEQTALSDLNYNLSVALQRVGRHGVAAAARARAVAQYEAALAENPDSPGVLKILGRIAMSDGDNDAAVAYFDRARVIAPDDPATHQALVEAHMAQRDVEAAILAARDGIRALEASGHPERARPLRQFVNQVDPDRHER